MSSPKKFLGPKIKLSPSQQRVAALSPSVISPVDATAEFASVGSAETFSTAEGDKLAGRSPDGKRLRVADFYNQYQKKRALIKTRRLQCKSLS